MISHATVVFPVLMLVPDITTSGALPFSSPFGGMAFMNVLACLPLTATAPSTSTLMGLPSSSSADSQTPTTPPRLRMSSVSPTLTCLGTLPTNPFSARRFPRATTRMSSFDIRTMRPVVISTWLYTLFSSSALTTMMLPAFASMASMTSTSFFSLRFPAMLAILWTFIFLAMLSAPSLPALRQYTLQPVDLAEPFRVAAVVEGVLLPVRRDLPVHQGKPAFAPDDHEPSLVELDLRLSRHRRLAAVEHLLDVPHHRVEVQALVQQVAVELRQLVLPE